MDAHAVHTHSVSPSTASLVFAKDLILVNTAINTLIVMLAPIANKKIHGHMLRSATRLTQTSSSVQTPTSADPLLTVGMCLKKTDAKM